MAFHLFTTAIHLQPTSGFVRQSGATEVDDMPAGCNVAIGGKLSPCLPQQVMVEFVDKGELGDCVGDAKDAKGNRN